MTAASTLARPASAQPRLWEVLCRDKAALYGGAIVVSLVLMALFAPWIVGDPAAALEANVLQRLKAPGAEHWLGTDQLGRDIADRIALGTRSAMGTALAVIAAAALIGVPLGLAAGYFTGWWSEAAMRVTDVFLAVPQLILALALAQLLQPGPMTVFLALALTYWPFFARTVYAETRRLRSAVFVDALEGLGAGPARILFAHVLPNVAAVIIVRASIGAGFVILTAAVLGFLGMGNPPPAPDWGQQIADSRQYLPDAWWFALFPGLAMFVAVLGFNLLGDGLRDLLDPKVRRTR